jgi:Response regulator receiver domain
MKTKQLSNSDLFITPVRFGSSAWEHSLAPIHRALELLGRMSPTAATILAVVLVAVIAWFDYVTGDFSLALFYLVPVVLATWNAGRVTGWFIGVLSAAAWLFGDAALSHAYGHRFLPYCNAAMLALIYGVVAHLLSVFHQLQAELQGTVNGIVAAVAIRGNFHVPVVFLTAHADDGTMERAAVAGAFGYVLKPFSGSALKAAIETALHKYQTEIETRRASTRAA